MGFMNLVGRENPGGYSWRVLSKPQKVQFV